MPSFKPKTVKKIKVNKKNSTTLDGKHKEFVNEFNKDENDRIPKLKEEKAAISCSDRGIACGQCPCRFLPDSDFWNTHDRPLGC